MLVTALASFDMHVRGEALSTRLAALMSRLLGRRLERPAPPVRPPLRLVAPPDAAPGETGAGPAGTAAPSAEFPWRRHPQLLTRDDPAPDASRSERRARAAAVRGTFNARNGDYEAARLAFADAARDPVIDLKEVPAFWHLPRAGMTAAVLAYEDVGRLRDATALAAEINHRFRPRPIRPTPPPTRTPRAAGSK